MFGVFPGMDALKITRMDPTQEGLKALEAARNLAKKTATDAYLKALETFYEEVRGKSDLPQKLKAGALTQSQHDEALTKLKEATKEADKKHDDAQAESQKAEAKFQEAKAEFQKVEQMNLAVAAEEEEKQWAVEHGARDDTLLGEDDPDIESDDEKMERMFVKLAAPTPDLELIPLDSQALSDLEAEHEKMREAYFEALSDGDLSDEDLSDLPFKTFDERLNKQDKALKAFVAALKEVGRAQMIVRRSLKK